MDLVHISNAVELLTIEHPHFGKIKGPGFLKAKIGILTGTNRKAVAIEDHSSGRPQTVALNVDPRDFMVTIARSFVLVTMKEGVDRPPVIHKAWKMVKEDKGAGLTEFYGTVRTYSDSDGLKWEHRFNRTTDEDELVGYGRNGEEVLIITLENFRG